MLNAFIELNDGCVISYITWCLISLACLNIFEI